MTHIAPHFSPQTSLDPNFPSATLLDVTLRDGSFAVGFHWQEETIRRIVKSLIKTGVPAIELGYYGGLPELHNIENPGLTADLPLSFVNELISAQHSTVQFSVMIHPGSVKTIPDFVAIKQTGISLVRFVYHPTWHDQLSEMVRVARQSELKVSINLALCSRYNWTDLFSTAQSLADTGLDMLYLADTCSALLPGQVCTLFEVLSTSISCELGFHGHDFLSLAFANSIVSAQYGAKYIDVSLWGIGRGAGNLRMELWAVTAGAQGATRYNLEALLPALDTLRICPSVTVQDDLLYLVSGAYNLTPPEENLLRKVAQKLELPESVIAARFAEHRHQIDTMNESALLNLLSFAYSSELQ